LNCLSSKKCCAKSKTKLEILVSFIIILDFFKRQFQTKKTVVTNTLQIIIFAEQVIKNFKK